MASQEEVAENLMLLQVDFLKQVSSVRALTLGDSRPECRAPARRQRPSRRPPLPAPPGNGRQLDVVGRQ